jgi:NADH dehydrogenase
MLRPHIVILGAGFGGTYVGKKLARHVRAGEVDVTIVDRSNYFLFTPLLHEVATGALSPRSVAEPLREIFEGTGVRIVQGAVVSVDLTGKSIKLDGGGGIVALAYDYLVITTGAETNYYGIPGAAELAMPLKSLLDAARLRNRVIDAFEQAVLTEDPGRRKALLSFAVVGGGPTGVETAAELAGFTKGIARRYYDGSHCRPGDPRSCEPEEVTVTLVNSGKEILGMFDPGLRASAEARLRKNGVEIRNGVAVTRVTPTGLETADGQAIQAATVIWTAGVKARVPSFEGIEPVLSGGRLAVDGYFHLVGNDHVFVLGDAAAYVENEKALPMLAQVATTEARAVAANIMSAVEGNALHGFHYHSRGSMVSVGQWFAIGDVFGLKLSGRLTWWLWRTVYLFKFASWRKRVRIAFEWAFELISPRDITKI